MDGKPSEVWCFIIAVIVFVFSSVKGEIRCYCNQAACVSTSYMCKSTSLCFSDLESGVHGCLEGRGRRCLGLRCCGEDMCNYLHVDINTRVHNYPIPGETDSDISDDRMALMVSAIRKDIWFKAVVIATPIAGLCILLCLIYVAAKLLRPDSHHHRAHLQRVYGGHSLRDTLLPWQKEKNITVV